MYKEEAASAYCLFTPSHGKKKKNIEVTNQQRSWATSETAWRFGRDSDPVTISETAQDKSNMEK